MLVCVKTLSPLPVFIHSLVASEFIITVLMLFLQHLVNFASGPPLQPDNHIVVFASQLGNKMYTRVW